MYKRTEAQNNNDYGALLLTVELDSESSLLSLPFAPPSRRLGTASRIALALIERLVSTPDRMMLHIGVVGGRVLW